MSIVVINMHNICYMYVYNSYSDIEQYAIFKSKVDKSYFIFTDKSYFIFTAQVTPLHFPSETWMELWTWANSLKLDSPLVSTDNNPKASVEISTVATEPSFKQPSVIYLRQYICPLLMPSSLQDHPPSIPTLTSNSRNLKCLASSDKS
jgi:hypothetical protein